jgi:hypothetical protein
MKQGGHLKMEVKAWSFSNFHMKGICGASYVSGVEIHRKYFEVFLYGKLQIC